VSFLSRAGISIARTGSPVIWEGAFESRLATQSLRPEVFALLTEVVEDAWKARTAEGSRRRQDLSPQLEALQERRDRLVDAFVRRSVIDQATYDRQVQRLDQEERQLLDALDLEAPRDFDLDLARGLGAG
jgi:uncharacterized protein YicC (UPF0701 family)